MTQEQKELVAKDISSRLVYGLHAYVKISNNNSNIIKDLLFTPQYFNDWLNIPSCQKDVIKPYLRPMSSMTEEEKEYVKNRWCYEDWNDIHNFLNHYQIDVGDAFSFVDWLNSHHFDYRGLIEKGLAIEAPEGMYGNKSN